MFHKNRSVKLLRNGTYGFLFLFEKTRKSNHLQMSLHLKTLSVGPAGVRTHDLPLSRLVLSQLSSAGDGYWANLPSPKWARKSPG